MSTTRNLAEIILDVTDGMDRAAEEIACLAHALATAEQDTNLGAAYLLARIRDDLRNLSRAAIAAQHREVRP